MIVGTFPTWGSPRLLAQDSSEEKRQTGDRPGVTRGNNGLLENGMQLLDHRILWPEVPRTHVGPQASLCGSIKAILNVQDLAYELLKVFRKTPRKIRHGNNDDAYEYDSDAMEV